jgi:RNA polymerase-binding transcription factor DksA
MNKTSHLTEKFIEEMKELLLAKKSELEESVKGFSQHTELGDDLDSQVQEVEDDEVSSDILETMNSDLKKVEIALQKIEAGTYGTDDEGKQISEARLQVIPWADKAI